MTQVGFGRVAPPPSKQLFPFQCIYHYVKLYISRLCILGVVFDFCAMPQIMFMNMWVSISSFNDEHHFQSRVIPAVVVKGKSCMCCDNQGKSSLFSCLPFFGLILFLGSISFLELSFFWLVIIFGVIYNFGVSIFLRLSSLFDCLPLVVVSIIGSSSFLRLYQHWCKLVALIMSLNLCAWA